MTKKSKTSHSDNTDRDEINTKPDIGAGIFPVVGIGSSAGGLSAFTELLKVLPINIGMAFILMQHLDPKHISLLPELMKRATRIPVIEASDDLRIKPNHIYVMPPNRSLKLMNGVLHLMPRPDKHGKHLPIDDFLNSLAEDYQTNAIGVILSGTGSDGTLGMQAIKTAGGIIFAQSEDSAEYDGMPHSAISAGYADFVLTPEEIAQKLQQISRHPYLLQKLPDVETKTSTQISDINKIFLLLRARTGVDFTYYKLSTIRRRIKRRMQLHQIERINDYIKLLQTCPKELDILFQDILINVTSFFRDPKTLEALNSEIFPRIVKELSSKQAIRIWIPACSSGEEAYSVAIVLFEFLSDRIKSTKIKIFATDIDKQAIEKARQGIYPPNICDNVEPKRLQRFFIKTATGYQICKMIREVCVFAVQDVTKDPPFSHLDLICCRNLLIYFRSILQRKVLRTFHYALRPNRFLMLGTSETVGSEAELFSVVDKKNKIYIRKSLASNANTDFTTPSYTPPSISKSHLATTSTLPASDDTFTKNYLIVFEPSAEKAIQHTRLQPETYGNNVKDLRIKELENELLTEREYMQSIFEEQEETNEELQSANEEIQSANEELQSTNEELETTKEELQSTNEELTTIIEENENHNQELNVINNDLNNLLTSIDLAVVILHKDLCIRRFTAPAKTLLNLIDTDMGRPIGNLQPNVNIPDLEKQLQQVIETIIPRSLEVQDHDGHWYALRLRPYRTLDDRIDGVVMEFLDIDKDKQAEQLQQILKHEQRLAAVVRDSNDAVTVQDFSGRILAWNRRATAMYGYSEEEALQLNATALIPDKASESMRILTERLRHGETVPSCESWRRNKHGKQIKVWLTTSILLSDAEIPSAIAITEREIK